MRALNEANGIYRSWLAETLVESLREGPPILWHYTNATGLRGILTDQRLWATQATFLNDSAEGSYGVARFMRALREFRDDAAPAETRDYLDWLCEGGWEPILTTFEPQHFAVFVACFCENGDLLSQWRAYSGGDTAGGYAIGFETPGSPLAWPMTAPGNHRLAMRRIRYDDDEQGTVCNALFAPLAGLLASDPKDLVVQHAFQGALMDALLDAATTFKHPAFAEEREWRVVYVRPRDEDPLPVEHRTVGGMVVPYVSLVLPAAVGADPGRLPVTRVSCGPSTDPARKQDGVRSLLRSLDLSGVAVEGSLAPLRL